jgi:hypothetical protein
MAPCRIGQSGGPENELAERHSESCVVDRRAEHAVERLVDEVGAGLLGQAERAGRTERQPR